MKAMKQTPVIDTELSAPGTDHPAQDRWVISHLSVEDLYASAILGGLIARRSEHLHPDTMRELIDEAGAAAELAVARLRGEE